MGFIIGQIPIINPMFPSTVKNSRSIIVCHIAWCLNSYFTNFSCAKTTRDNSIWIVSDLLSFVSKYNSMLKGCHPQNKYQTPILRPTQKFIQAVLICPGWMSIRPKERSFFCTDNSNQKLHINIDMTINNKKLTLNALASSINCQNSDFIFLR